MKTNKCKKHSKYKAIHFPKVNCIECINYYNEKHK